MALRCKAVAFVRCLPTAPRCGSLECSVRRSSSHPTAHNSKERSSVAKSGEGAGGGGDYAGGVSRVVQTGVETGIFARARSNSAIGYSGSRYPFFFGPCFFVLLLSVASRSNEGNRGESHVAEATNASGHVNFRRTRRIHVVPRVSVRHDFRSFEETCLPRQVRSDSSLTAIHAFRISTNSGTD